ncbi:dynamin-binding protein isoform X2 [Narcine bancroftii]|uniref:dynamin-binding protein isoform X2 n=1 Tax=Narcine bancroftii TaxID=1343680 RepID=UPI0038318F1A
MEPGSLVRAVFEFCPSVSEELPIFGGDVIEVLSVVDEFWLLGKKDGVTGQFPSSFVEPVYVPNTKLGEKLCVCTNDFRPTAASELPLKRGDVIVVEGPLDGTWHRGRTYWGTSGLFPSSCARELRLSSRARELSLKALGELPHYGLGRARALMGLSAQLPEELDFNEGDVITIVGLPEPGWFEGELGGRRGIFPEGFVELMGPLQSPEAGARVHEGEAEGPVEVEAEGPVEVEVAEDLEESTGPGLYGMAMYDFHALEAEELDFAKGDRIRITGTLEDGWLQGTLRGRAGVFPIRFVQLESAGVILEDQDKTDGVDCREKGGSQLGGLEVMTLNPCDGRGPSSLPAHPLGLRPATVPCLPSLPAVAEGPEVLAKTSDGRGSWGQQESEGSDYRGQQGSERRDSWGQQGSEGRDSRGHQGSEGQSSREQQGSEGWGSWGQQESEEKDSWGQQGSEGRDSWGQQRSERWDSQGQQGSEGQGSRDQQGSEGPEYRGQQGSEERDSWSHQGSEGRDSRSHQGSEGRDSRDQQGSKGWGSCGQLESKERDSWGQQGSEGRDSRGQQGSEGHGSRDQQGSEGWGSWGQQGSEGRTSGSSFFTESPGTVMQSNGWIPVPLAENKTPIARGDLDTKWSEQIEEFGRSIPVTRSEVAQPVRRHFSISDFHTEQDVARGSGQTSGAAPLPARPAPPRPFSPTISLRPSRPAPLPPPRRPEPYHPRCPPRPVDMPGPPLEGEGDSEQGSSPQWLQRRARELDWDQTWHIDKTTSQENPPSRTTEDPDLSWNIRTLEGEFPTPTDMTLLSIDRTSLEPPPVSATAERLEQKMMEKRAKVIEELLQTEADYIKDLVMCVEKVLIPLQAKELQQVDCEALFGNMKTVIEVSRRLLEELEETDSIGQVFLSYRNELQDMYNVYCQNHEEAIALLETYEKDKEIQGHVNACLDHLRGKTNYINLGSFLIKPVQRVMRYPLLLSELLNSTPEGHQDKKPLEEAMLAVKELNVNINEYKRRKDLVLKYRKGDEDSLMDKISKLSMHSIIKKSNRVSSHLKHLTGLAPQIRNEAFQEVERRFREQERLIKNFIRDLSLYLQHLRDSASVKVLAAMSILDMYSEKNHTDLERYQRAHRLISDSLFNDFRERTEKLVISPLTQLLGMCAGPNKLMIKRFDKLLDYHNCKERAEKLKDKRTLDELQAAKNNYEALNAQLLDDMPRFHKSAEELFISCVRGFADVHRDFVDMTLEELLPLSQLILVVNKDTTIVASFQEQHSKAMKLLQAFSFFPDTLPCSRKPFERKTTERQSSRWQLSAMPMATFQSGEQRTSLLAKYEPDKLYQADRNFNAAQELDLSLLEGDLVGVIKQQDPMGSQNRWLVDNGATRGFVYSSFLKPYDSRRSHSDVSVESHSSNESGYDGSSPVISWQDNTSVLTVNHSAGTASYSTETTGPPRPQQAETTRSEPSLRPPTLRSNTFDPSSAASSPRSKNSCPAAQPKRSSQMEYSLPRRSQETSRVLRRAASQEGYLDGNSFDPGQQVYYAVYDFRARCSNELSITNNQRLRILRFHDMNGNQEWWLAEANGRQGYVPATYIRKTEYT